MAMAAHEVVTGVVRLSFLRVFEPQSFAGSAEKYSARLLLPKSDKATIKKINAAIEAAVELGKTKFKWSAKQASQLDLPLRDGDEDVDLEKYPEHENHYFINAKSSTQPRVCKPNGKDKQGKNQFLDITDSTELWSGCYGKVHVTFWPFDTAGNRGVSAILNIIVKTQDGEAFGSRVVAEEVFADDEFDLDDDDEDFLD